MSAVVVAAAKRQRAAWDTSPDSFDQAIVS